MFILLFIVVYSVHKFSGHILSSDVAIMITELPDNLHIGKLQFSQDEQIFILSSIICLLTIFHYNFVIVTYP